MRNEEFVKIADQISNKLIEISENQGSNNKSIIQLFNELLDDKYLDNQYEILSYIPERLSVKGYEIVNSSEFKLKKY